MAIKRILFEGLELLPPRRDIVLKALFLGKDGLELLASLLSCVLDQDIRAQDIIITNTELPKIHESGKLSRIDLRVKLSCGEHVNVELQLENEYNIARRSIFYTAKLYVDQLVSPMEFNELCPTIAINILDFDYLPYEDYHNTYRLKNIKTNDELTDVFEIHFIELKKVPKDSSKHMKDLWMRFISADSEEELKVLSEESAILKKAVEKLIYVSSDEDLRYQLDMREKADLDYWSAMKTNYRKGKEEGRKEGKDEGRHEQALAIASKLVSIGEPIEKIISVTGLTYEEVERL